MGGGGRGEGGFGGGVIRLGGSVAPSKIGNPSVSNGMGGGGGGRKKFLGRVLWCASPFLLSFPHPFATLWLWARAPAPTSP